jgi:hypothetical protein
MHSNRARFGNRNYQPGADPEGVCRSGRSQRHCRRSSPTVDDRERQTLGDDFARWQKRVRVGRGLVGSVTPIPFSLMKVGSHAPRRKNDNVTYTQEAISDRRLSMAFMAKRMLRSGLPERTVTWPLRCRRRGRRRNEHWYVWLYGTVFYFATLTGRESLAGTNNSFGQGHSRAIFDTPNLVSAETVQRSCSLLVDFFRTTPTNYPLVLSHRRHAHKTNETQRNDH